MKQDRALYCDKFKIKRFRKEESQNIIKEPVERQLADNCFNRILNKNDVCVLNQFPSYFKVEVPIKYKKTLISSFQNMFRPDLEQRYIVLNDGHIYLVEYSKKSYPRDEGKF